MRRWLLWFALAGCNEDPDSPQPTEDPPTCEAPAPAPEPPACGTATTRDALLPGGDPLANKAHDIDRLFHGLMVWPTSVNQELTVPLDDSAAREAIDAFVDSEGWDFEAETGLPPDQVGTWSKAAGAYAGVGIAADAFRYGVLRDEGAPCDEVDRAREHLLAGLDSLHLAMAITGAEGVIARGFARSDLSSSYGQVVETTPLFDEDGDPLPEEKDNGTWREDASGDYPGWRWEDSCSRDMLVGWALAFGAAWEVVRSDATFDDAVRDRLRADAGALGRSMSVIRDSGFDLEIRDGDGRRTFHGTLHEESIDRFYVPGSINGQHALMALGIVSTLAWVAGDDDLHAYVAEELIGERRLHELARDYGQTIDLGVGSNFSGYNMGFLGGLLAQRYLCEDEARDAVRTAIDTTMYDRPDRGRQPVEQSQALYHLAALLARGGGSALEPMADVDAASFEALTRDLDAYPAPPFWDHAVDHCAHEGPDAPTCTAEDGTVFTNLGPRGWNGTLVVSEEPIPLHLRPPSNYFWRSNPYQLSGGGSGATLLPGPDFRVVYWMSRWASAPTP
jgi:hypothetical protein